MSNDIEYSTFMKFLKIKAHVFSFHLLIYLHRDDISI